MKDTFDFRYFTRFYVDSNIDDLDGQLESPLWGVTAKYRIVELELAFLDSTGCLDSSL